MDINKKSKEKDEEMATMKFVAKKIAFYPDDIKKMESMPHKEKMEYVKKLRQEHRYIDLED